MVNGGESPNASQNGGAGSGGSLKIIGRNVTLNNAALEARGGDVRMVDGRFDRSGGAGGGTYLHWVQGKLHIEPADGTFPSEGLYSRWQFDEGEGTLLRILREETQVNYISQCLRSLGEKALCLVEVRRCTSTAWMTTWILALPLSKKVMRLEQSLAGLSRTQRSLTPGLVSSVFKAQPQISTLIFKLMPGGTTRSMCTGLSIL